MSRFRRRVDGVLTGMLSDHEHEQTSASSGGTAAGAAEDEEKRFAAPSAWHGGYVDALPSRPRRPDGEQLWPLGNRRPGAASKPDDGDRASAAAPGHDELRPLASPGQQLSDTFRWFIAAPVDDPHAVRDPGAEEITDYRSKHGLEDPAEDSKPQGGRRRKARHAAPADTLGAARSPHAQRPRVDGRVSRSRGLTGTA